MPYLRLKNLPFFVPASLISSLAMVAQEAALVFLVEQSQQTARQVVAGFFQEKEKEIPALCQKLLQKQITFAEATDFLCGTAVAREVLNLARNALKQKFNLPFRWEGSFLEYLPEIKIAQRELTMLGEDLLVEKALALAGSWCYETILEKFFPLVFLKGYVAAKLWSYVWASFTVNQAPELEKWLTGLVACVKVRLTQAIEEVIAEDIYSTYDPFREKPENLLAG